MLSERITTRIHLHPAIPGPVAVGVVPVLLFVEDVVVVEVVVERADVRPAFAPHGFGNGSLFSVLAGAEAVIYTKIFRKV